MGIFDRIANLGEQPVDSGGQLGKAVADDAWSGAGEIAMLDREQTVGKRRQRSRALAIGAFGRDVADQQAEETGDNRGDDLGVELGDVEESDEREDERCETRNARQEGIADLLRRAFLDRGN